LSRIGVKGGSWAATSDHTHAGPPCRCAFAPHSCRPDLPYRAPVKQTGSAKPQAFALELRHAGHSSESRTFDFGPSAPKTLELVFSCSFSGNNECPANRFQSGAVQRVEVSVRGGEKTFDLTCAATVLPEGQIVKGC